MTYCIVPNKTFFSFCCGARVSVIYRTILAICEAFLVISGTFPVVCGAVLVIVGTFPVVGEAALVKG